MNKMKLNVIVLGLSIAFVSCLSTEEKKEKAEAEGNAIVSIKSKLLKGAGDALKTDGKEAIASVTEGVGEVIKGMTSGYDKSINQANVVPDSLFTTYFNLGRTSKKYSDTTNIKKVSVYLISKKSFDGKVKLKAFDESKTEIGRSIQNISILEDDAKFYDFNFDDRTPLLQASFFTIETK